LCSGSDRGCPRSGAKASRIISANSANPSETVNVAKVLATLKDRLSKIDSLAYAVHRGTPQSEVYSSFSWKEIGNNYWCDIASVNNSKTGGFNMHYIASFDGKRTSVLRKNGDIEIRNGEIAGLLPSVYHSPLDIYSFLKVEDKFLCLNYLNSNTSLWSNLKSRVSYVRTEKFTGRDCFVLRFLGGFDQRLQEKADYDVYFDSVTLMPLGWRAFDSQKNLIEQLEVLEFKTIIGKSNASPFMYPDHYRFTDYQSPLMQKEPSGIVNHSKGVRDVHLDDVQINSLSPEDIQIDPSVAKAIIDVDAHGAIPIPR
jgi:hypothetical protein